MIRGFYTAGSGLISGQNGIDNAANNLANINSAGYKKQTVRFSDLLYSNLATPDSTNPQNLKVGNGTATSEVTSLHTQGTMQFTGNQMDFAITSDGYFGVLGQDGTINYTRDGSFYSSRENNDDYLVTANGDYVVDKTGGKIKLGQENLMDQIGVFNFPNTSGLETLGNNKFGMTDNSGAPVAIQGEIVNGCLELSNVDLSGEMTDLIAIQKSYQFNAKMIQTTDEIENIINNLR